MFCVRICLLLLRKFVTSQCSIYTMYAHIDMKFRTWKIDDGLKWNEWAKRDIHVQVDSTRRWQVTSTWGCSVAWLFFLARRRLSRGCGIPLHLYTNHDDWNSKLKLKHIINLLCFRLPFLRFHEQRRLTTNEKLIFPSFSLSLFSHPCHVTVGWLWHAHSTEKS